MLPRTPPRDAHLGLPGLVGEAPGGLQDDGNARLRSGDRGRVLLREDPYGLASTSREPSTDRAAMAHVEVARTADSADAALSEASDTVW
jgi:hypothetical protein